MGPIQDRYKKYKTIKQKHEKNGFITFFGPKTKYSLAPFLRLAIVVARWTNKDREFHIILSTILFK